MCYQIHTLKFLNFLKLYYLYLFVKLLSPVIILPDNIHQAHGTVSIDHFTSFVDCPRFAFNRKQILQIFISKCQPSIQRVLCCSMKCDTWVVGGWSPSRTECATSQRPIRRLKRNNIKCVSVRCCIRFVIHFVRKWCIGLGMWPRHKMCAWPSTTITFKVHIVQVNRAEGYIK